MRTVPTIAARPPPIAGRKCISASSLTRSIMGAVIHYQGKAV